MSERKVGVVAKEFVNKGFVFLSVDDKAPNVFAHVSAFKASGLNFNAIQRGDTFSFELEEGRDGRPVAVRLEVVQ